MLSTVVLAAGLSTGHKIGLAAVGGAFILFALVSSFVLPLRNPNFPGKGLGWFAALAALFFVAMLAAVVVFGKEGKEVASAGTAPATATTTTTSGTTATATAPAAGNAVAGKAVFATAGCGGCHTLKAAGATGAVGPNLDSLKPDLAAIVHQVEVGGGPMPAFKGQLSDQQIQDVAAFVYASTHA